MCRPVRIEFEVAWDGSASSCSAVRGGRTLPRSRDDPPGPGVRLGGIDSGDLAAQRRRNLLDGVGLGRAHALAVLPVRGGGLVRHGENEAPVAVDLLGRCLTLQHSYRVAQVLESVVPELVE